MLDKIKRLRPSNAVLLGFIAVLIAVNYYGSQQKIVPSPIVEIANGKIRGIISRSRDGKEFFEFRGIPYAKAPIGELRFEVPQPAVSWEGVRDTSAFLPECIQINPVFKETVTGVEDCLFLNVFSPKVGSGFSQSLLPVMVFLHGGFFMAGSATTHGPKYFLDEYVVLVTVNYRLSSFGFLNTGDGVVRGNMGLKDQTMALRWVQENIKHFGGDNKRVTLFGESAGSTAVNFHLLSNMSRGLFSKAIGQSGTAYRVWATQLEPRRQALRLAKRLDCEKATMQESINCMKGLRAETIAETHKEANTPIINRMFMYAPSLETTHKDAPDTFITEEPTKIVAAGRGNNVPWMIGVNSAEGLLYTARVRVKEEYRNEYDKNFKTFFPQFFVYDENNVEVTRKLRKFYLNVDENEVIEFDEHFVNYTNLLSDRIHNLPTRVAANLQSKYSPVYLYYNDYSAEFTLYDFLALEGKLPVMVEIILKLLSNWFQKSVLGRKPGRFGVCHADELYLIFAFPQAEITHNSKDYEMSRALVKLWVQFAYDEKELKFNSHRWTPVSPNVGHKYMQFSNDAESNKLIDEPAKERIDFWESLNLLN